MSHAAIQLVMVNHTRIIVSTSQSVNNFPRYVDTAPLYDMATGIFRTYSEVVLLNMREQLTQALVDVTIGDKAVGISMGGKSYTFTVASMNGIRELLDEVNLSLQAVNPTAYGKRVTHTYPNFQVLTPEDK